MGVRPVLALARALLGDLRVRSVLLVAGALATTGLSTLALFSMLGFAGEVSGAALAATDVSVGDAILWLFLGHPTGLRPEWAAPWALVLVVSLLDLRGQRAALFVQAGSRARAWAASCVAAAGSALAGCAALVLGMAGWALALGGTPTLAPRSIQELSFWTLTAEGTAADVALFVGVIFAGAVFLALAQLALGLVAGPAVAFLAAVALVVGAAFAPLLPLPGSWLMASRMAPFAAGGSSVSAAWPAWVPLAAFACGAAACVLVGLAVFSRGDLGTAPGGGGR